MHRLITFFKRGFCAMVFMAVLPVFSAFGACDGDTWKTLTGYSDSCICGTNTQDCEINFDSLGTGSKFEIQTTTFNTGTSFSFGLTAKGTFYIDWGDGTIQRIERDDTTTSLTTYSHQYTYDSDTPADKKPPYTIRFGGVATGYLGTSYNVAAISFQSNANISRIYGSLAEIFPTVDGAQPKFFRTFYSCTNLTGALPANLFSSTGLTGATITNMFYQTFRGSSNLGKTAVGVSGNEYYIPSTIFGNLTINTSHMSYTFNGTSLRTTTNGCPTGTTRWDLQNNKASNSVAYDTRVACKCNGTGELFSINGVAPAYCSCPTYQAVNSLGVCDCISGYVWDSVQGACVPDVTCSDPHQDPNSDCACIDGYDENGSGGCDVHTYNITYKYYDSGSWVNYSGLVPSTYNVEDSTFALPTPSAVTGYTFGGWYDGDPDASGSNLVADIPEDSTGDKVFYAKWTPKTITCASAGQYLPANSETCTACPANSYCPNPANTQYTYTGSAQGATSCNTATSGEYPYSDGGTSATSINSCYKTKTESCGSCTIDGGTCHYSNQSGNTTCTTYYGLSEVCDGGCGTKTIDDCNTGYYINDSVCSLHTYNITYKYYDSGSWVNYSGLVPSTYNVEDSTFTLPTPSAVTGYTFGGWYDDDPDAVGSNLVADIPEGSTGNKVLYAKWTPKTITCASAGQYLPANSETCAACPTDSYCPNAANTQYTYTGSAQGATACPGAYPNSDGGITAVSEDSCYASGTQTCSQYNVCPDHATCSYANTTAACRTFYNTNTCVLENPNACDYTFTCNTGYEQNGSICEVVTCNGGKIILPDPPSNNSGTGLVKIVAWTDEGDCWQNNTTNTELRFCNGTSTTNFGVFDTNNYEFRVYFVNKGGAISGYSRCSTDENTAHQYTAYAGGNPNGPVKNYSSGRYCWCQLSTYEKGTANNFVTYDITSDWISSGAGIMSSASACDSSCSELCAKRVADMEREPKELRRALYNSVKNACIIGCPYDATEQYNTTTETSTCSCLNNVQTWSSETNTCNCPQGYTKDDSSPENTTCVADNYNINYDNDGGACGGTNSPNCGPLTYTVEDAVSLDNPTKTHYKFDGWCKYDNSQNDGNACLVSDTAHYVQPQTNPASIIAIAAGSTEARWFYAKYADFYVHYKCDINDVVDQGVVMAPYMDTFNVPANDYGCSTPTGYHFTGWVCKYRDGAGGAASSDLATDGTATYDKAVDAECVAQYAPNAINLNWNNNYGDTAISGADQCLYNSQIQPVQQTSRPGYTFNGWEITSVTLPTP